MPHPVEVAGSSSGTPRARREGKQPRTVELVGEELEEVKAIMKENIARVIERDEKLSGLEIKAEQLSVNASFFKRASQRLKRKFWWKNAKYSIVLTIVAGVIVGAIVLAVIL